MREVLRMAVILFCTFFLIFTYVDKAYSSDGSWNYCNQQNKTPEQQKRCSLFNEKSNHYRKLKDSVKDLGRTIRKPIEVPDGVRRQQQQQQQYQYIK